MTKRLALLGTALSAALVVRPDAAAAQGPTPIDGATVFKTTCATCHSITPPYKAAPPMTHVVRHYTNAGLSEDSVVTRIAAWIAAPSKEGALMPAHAIERFGLMPAQDLPLPQRLAVARYVLTLTAQTPEP
jgi:mono/diheme cytochrome c family protein